MDIIKGQRYEEKRTGLICKLQDYIEGMVVLYWHLSKRTTQCSERGFKRRFKIFKDYGEV